MIYRLLVANSLQINNCGIIIKRFYMQERFTFAVYFVIFSDNLFLWKMKNLQN